MAERIVMGMTEEHQITVVNAIREELEKGVPFEPSPVYPAEVNARIEDGGERIVDNASLTAAEREEVAKALNRVTLAKGRTAKFTRLVEASDAFVGVFGPRSACTSCKKPHCCYTPVTLTRFEAEFMAKAVGITPAKVSIKETPAASYDNPCTFLVQGRCSIYAHRPIVCRTHYNMDIDDLLCRLVEGTFIPVPYADTRMFASMAAEIIAIGDLTLADIRQWFPQGARK